MVSNRGGWWERVKEIRATVYDDDEESKCFNFPIKKNSF